MNVKEETIFLIEEDHTLVFPCGSMLYLSKINVGKGRYILELSNRYKRIGCRKAHCLKVADGMREIFLQCNKRFQSFDEALTFWKSAFALEKNLEFVFAMRVVKRTYDQATIGQYISKYNLLVDSHIGRVDASGAEPMRITLTFPNSKRPVGMFVGHFLKKDFRFEVIKDFHLL